jgi:hypothetical protein
LITAILLILTAASAWAASNRTFVSVSGSDSNPSRVSALPDLRRRAQADQSWRRDRRPNLGGLRTVYDLERRHHHRALRLLAGISVASGDAFTIDAAAGASVTFSGLGSARLELRTDLTVDLVSGDDSSDRGTLRSVLGALAAKKAFRAGLIAFLFMRTREERSSRQPQRRCLSSRLVSEPWSHLRWIRGDRSSARQSFRFLKIVMGRPGLRAGKSMWGECSMTDELGFHSELRTSSQKTVP